MHPEKIPSLIIGAGVVGCALAYELSLKKLAPMVLERHGRIADETSSRNSGVVHAGIYYPPESLKARSCIRGNALLYEWCTSHGVPHRKTGKWIVGTKAEEETLRATFEGAQSSGAQGLQWTEGRSQIEAECPGIVADVGIFSQETGIVDPYSYARSLQLAAEENGAQFVLNTAVESISTLPSGGYRVGTSRGPIDTEILINAAGLYADEVAALAGISKYKIFPWRGDYFKIQAPFRASRLIYPVKKRGSPGLGIHLTLGLDGSMRLGPDAHAATSKIDYSPPVDEAAKRQQFLEAARKFLPFLELSQISYDTCGIRPKLRSPEQKQDPDFVLSEDLPGFVNLVGIESPGLTAARDLAQRAVKLLGA